MRCILIGIKQKVEQMTIDEKIKMLSGANFWNTEAIERLDIPSMMLTDGPHGLRKQGGKADHLGLNASIPATCFPTAASLANSWDVNLAREMGEHLGREAANENVSVLLGPGLNIKRNPLCGRNFEYFSEDPFLSGQMAAGLITGIQSRGVSACPKHFAVNSQEMLRMTIDEIVDERALHEVYLEGFRLALKANPKTIMTSYNKVNGEYANENKVLIQDILRGRLGFDKLIVTDWGGNNDRVTALQVGNQLEMPSSGGITDIELKDALNAGEIDEQLIDQAVCDILELVYDTRAQMENLREENLRDFSVEGHHQKAVEIAEQSIVMLKNEMLPLPLNQTIGIIGDLGFTTRNQGAGSSLINPTKVVSGINAFSKSEYHLLGSERGYNRYGGRNRRKLKKALELAGKVDTVVMYVGLDESSETEGLDRFHMKIMENQIEVLKQVSQVNDNIILVLAGGAPIELGFEQYAKVILHGYLGGQGVSEGIVNIISGKTNPSGKLAETYPYKYEDVLSSKYFPGLESTSEHRESIFIGYRYFDTVGKPVRYPFGYGLSFTNFTYDNLKIDNQKITIEITNSGSVAGMEIVQMYIKPLKSKIFRANKELKGFAKVMLQPNETKTVQIEFEENSFKYFNTQTKEWETEVIDYQIEVGSNIDDIRAVGVIKTQTDKPQATDTIYVEKAVDVTKLYDREQLSGYFNLQREEITFFEFEKLCGRKLPQTHWNREQVLTLNDVIAQSEYQGILGKAIYKLLIFTNKLLLKLGQPIVANYIFFVVYMPFRQLSRFSGGKITENQVRKLLTKL